MIRGEFRSTRWQEGSRRQAMPPAELRREQALHGLMYVLIQEFDDRVLPLVRLIDGDADAKARSTPRYSKNRPSKIWRVLSCGS